MQNNALSKYRGSTGQKNSFTLFVLKRFKKYASDLDQIEIAGLCQEWGITLMLGQDGTKT